MDEGKGRADELDTCGCVEGSGFGAMQMSCGEPVGSRIGTGISTLHSNGATAI